MPTTTNNGWTTPADTDLVKNGALAIRTLGNAIDTTLGVYSAPGLSHINTTSFTTSSSQSLNDIFTSTYENYRFILQISAASTNLTVNLRLRVSGTSATGSNYFSNGSSSVSSTLSNVNLATTSLFLFDVYGADPQYSQATGDILIPKLTQFTRFNFQSYALNSAGSNTARSISGAHNLATAYDGIEIFPSTGTITGKVSIYGYKA